METLEELKAKLQMYPESEILKIMIERLEANPERLTTNQ